jgi:tight adherence protein C
MTAAVLLGACAGLGCLGVARGVHAGSPSLESIAAAMGQPTRIVKAEGRRRASVRLGRRLVEWVEGTDIGSHPRWLSVLPSLAIAGESREGLAAKVLLAGGAGLLGPPFVWLAAQSVGVAVSPAIAIVMSAIVAPGAAVLPIAFVLSRARDRRRHFRIVIGSFVDLVVLSLAGGVGIEGALYAASQVSHDWASTRMARALSKARDGGLPPWAGLGQLGEEIAVPELVELSSALELAGTEGARIRESLSSRAVSLRRHEQAEAEAAANAMTERLFLPGTLLLFGFLLFIGYPAFSRIVGGF